MKGRKEEGRESRVGGQRIIANEGDVEEMRQFRWRVITTSLLRDGMTELHQPDGGLAVRRTKKQYLRH